MAERCGIKTAYQLQTLLNIQPSVAAKWFRNDMKMISFESLNMLCKYFGCTVPDILVYTRDKDARKCFRATGASMEARNKLDKVREMRAKVKEFIATQLDDTESISNQYVGNIARATKDSNTGIDNIETKGSITDNKINPDTSPENLQTDNEISFDALSENPQTDNEINSDTSFDTPQTNNTILSHSLSDSVQPKDTEFNDIESKSIQSSNTSDNESQDADNKLYYSRYKLKGRGWTTHMIDFFLGKPDINGINGLRRKILYLDTRVEAIEKTKEFQEWQARDIKHAASYNAYITLSRPDGDDWITTEEIAKRLGLSKKSVTDYINKGILPSWQAMERTPHFVKESDYPAFELYYRNLTGKSKS